MQFSHEIDEKLVQDLHSSYNTGLKKSGYKQRESEMDFREYEINKQLYTTMVISSKNNSNNTLMETF